MLITQSWRERLPVGHLLAYLLFVQTCVKTRSLIPSPDLGLLLKATSRPFDNCSDVLSSFPILSHLSLYCPFLL